MLLNFSRKVDLFWSVADAELDAPESCNEETQFGGHVLWDVSQLPQLAKEARNHKSSGWIAYRDGLRERLPFMHVGNGDLIAFDMRKGNKNCPIVYLNHNNDPNYHDLKIADNFVDFLANWSAVGCIGPDFAFIEVYYNSRKRKISAANRQAKRWRKFMATGK